jgi:nucleotide-sensitive chloride channel 1A
VQWFDKESTTLISIDYQSIIIHAISRGDNDRLVRKPCIYCQIDRRSVNNNEEDEEEEDSIVAEMRIVPQTDEDCKCGNLKIFVRKTDELLVDDIFLALSECSALHPDPNEDEENDDVFQHNEEGWMPVMGGETEIELSEEGQFHMDRFNAMLRKSEDELEGQESSTKKAKTDHDDIVDR